MMSNIYSKNELTFPY